MAKADALDKVDELLGRGSHAKLNTRPGTRIVRELEELRDLIDGIDEA